MARMLVARDQQGVGRVITHTTTIRPKVDLANQVITIEEAVSTPDLFEPQRLMEQHARIVIDLRDKATRDALICLGWRPPAEPASSLPATIPQPDIRTLVRARDPGTSVAAAERVAAFGAAHSGRILDTLRGADLTPDEIGSACGLTGVQVSRRMRQLQELGHVAVVQVDDGHGSTEDLRRGGARVWRRLKGPTES